MNFYRGQREKYDNLYILPYIVPYEITVPYEVIINKVIKVNITETPESDLDTSNYIRFYLLLIYIIILLNILN